MLEVTVTMPIDEARAVLDAVALANRKRRDPNGVLIAPPPKLMDASVRMLDAIERCRGATHGTW